jgi:citrate synthase
MPEIQIYDGAVDKGLEGIVACTTQVSSILDATLIYRGYTIEDLAAHSSFEEVTYLLWNNRLPSASEIQTFSQDLSTAAQLPPEYIQALKALPTQVHPMAWLRTAVSLLAHYDSTANDNSAQAHRKKAISLTAKMGAIVCAFEALRNQRQVVQPKVGPSLAWNFMYMLSGGKEPQAELVKIFDLCLILHADHELNCSAFATRVTASSLSDIYSAIVSAIGALKGPLHGGANEQVILMLKKIGTIENAKKFVQDALNAKEKVMGIGHRVYKNGDPRAHLLQKISKELTAKVGKSDWYEMSVLIHETMEREKGLLPNVDFYSATVYDSMNIPTDLFTPIFAVSRISGWLAHADEQYANNRIYRPRGLWKGQSGLVWKPVQQRG